ncbi:Ca2+/Na+ antiporter [Candidatus Brocadia pituitae]|nr:Ca2+/Na+ antiporter [Candidatus Brocadia pituitae]
MEIFINLITLTASLGVLIFLGEKLINAAMRLAKAFGVSPTVIGLTVLAYGTSLPEFVVSSIAAVKQYSDLSVSNIVGSNIYNIAFILGIASIISSLSIKERIFAKRDGLVMLFAVVILCLFTYLGKIGRLTGMAMMVFITCYTYTIIRSDRVHGDAEPNKNLSKIREVIIVVLLLTGVLISGNFTVNYAVKLARSAGITEWLIGATIVASGTSLPETVVSIIAARKGEYAMSIGNIVGSNIFNILWILGFASILHPLTIGFPKIYPDLIFLAVITLLFYAGLCKGRLTKGEGMLYIALYIGYIYCLL